MPATITRTLRVTRIEASPADAMPGGQVQAKPDRIIVSAAELDDAGNPIAAPTQIQLPFDDPAAAAFFVVNQDVVLTFSKPAS